MLKISHLLSTMLVLPCFLSQSLFGAKGLIPKRRSNLLSQTHLIAISKNKEDKKKILEKIAKEPEEKTGNFLEENSVAYNALHVAIELDNLEVLKILLDDKRFASLIRKQSTVLKKKFKDKYPKNTTFISYKNKPISWPIIDYTVHKKSLKC